MNASFIILIPLLAIVIFAFAASSAKRRKDVSQAPVAGAGIVGIGSFFIVAGLIGFIFLLVFAFDIRPTLMIYALLILTFISAVGAMMSVLVFLGLCSGPALPKPDVIQVFISCMNFLVALAALLFSTIFRLFSPHLAFLIYMFTTGLIQLGSSALAFLGMTKIPGVESGDIIQLAIGAIPLLGAVFALVFSLFLVLGTNPIFLLIIYVMSFFFSSIAALVTRRK